MDRRNPPAADAAPSLAEMLTPAEIDNMRLSLPKMLCEVARRFGNQKALLLASTFGGKPVHLPARPRPDHPIAEAVGEDVLAFLIDEYGGAETVVIPIGATAKRQLRDCIFARMLRDKATNSEIAEACGMHIRNVFQLKAQMRLAGGATGRASRRPKSRTGDTP
jgi:hypothetical protein